MTEEALARKLRRLQARREGKPYEERDLADWERTERKLRKSNAPFYVGLVVVDPETGFMLMGKRKEDDLWTGPGGGADPKESPSEAAIREAYEEANLKLDERDLIELPSHITKNGKLCHCFLVYVSPNSQHIHPRNDPDKEVDRWDWYNEIPGETDKDRRTTINYARMKMIGLLKSYFMMDDTDGMTQINTTEQSEERETEPEPAPIVEEPPKIIDSRIEQLRSLLNGYAGEIHIHLHKSLAEKLKKFSMV